MKIANKGICFTIFAIVFLVSCVYSSQGAEKDSNILSDGSMQEMKKDSTDVYLEELMKRLKLKADSARVYARQNKLNTDYSILVDLSIHSGRNRFFVWNHHNDTVEISSLCCHGKGGGSTQDTPVFSNVPGSLCSSKGHYKVGVRAPSKHGIYIHYKLHGLEKTNDNAYKRYIVLHSYDSIPWTEVYPEYIRFSEGCPAIADDKMRVVDTLLQKLTKPLLLWIYS